MLTEMTQTRTTAVHDRFHVGLADTLDATDKTFAGALTHARWLAKREQQVVWLWDNMAKRGAKQEWKVTPDGHCTIVGHRQE